MVLISMVQRITGNYTQLIKLHPIEKITKSRLLTAVELHCWGC